MPIRRETLVVGPIQANCHLLTDEASGETLVFDPGDEAERIVEAVRRHGGTVKGILLTHAHLDHAGGAGGVREATGAPILLHPGDRQLYERLASQAAMFGLPQPTDAPIDRWIGDGDRVEWAGGEVQVLHTPGHTPGGVTFAVGGLLVVGDTLFAGSIGRTDLWGGSFEQIMASIRDRILACPDETPVLTGHGPDTTVGDEKTSNPFVTGRYRP